MGKRINMPIIICPDCGKERKIPNAHRDRSGFTGLCRACWHKSQRGVNSPWYKNGTWADHAGYKRTRIFPEDFFYPMADKNGYVFEHRLVMAKHLERLLQRWEHVHHKNGIRNDNRLENLELTTNGAHHIAHNKGYKDGFQRGYLDGKTEAQREGQERVEKLIGMMALERCDSDVMPYFTDYYWIPKDVIDDFKKQEEL